MEWELLNALDGFDAVWRRVMSASGEKMQETRESPAFQAAMDDAMALWETYTAFARQVQGAAGARFATLAEDVRHTVRTLQTACFLDTGDLYRPVKTAALTHPGVLSGMRRARETERRLSDALEDPMLAAQAAGRAETLRGMIAALLEQ